MPIAKAAFYPRVAPSADQSPGRSKIGPAQARAKLLQVNFLFLHIFSAIAFQIQVVLLLFQNMSCHDATQMLCILQIHMHNIEHIIKN
ncbi:hypothetical protein [Desulfovibrio sp. An276]|uniref:hypothetical protein n=1 Tax=Desulfovibrio sp. An276 TaxID=1965618 RepID=UPI0013A5FC22|nr:hypothetical protein [Desulfovibrio sp. An276]